MRWLNTTTIVILLLLCVAVSYQNVDALQQNYRFTSPCLVDTTTSLQAKKGRPKKNSISIATTSIEDSRRVQAILRNRCVRGRPRLITGGLIGEDNSSIESTHTLEVPTKTKQWRRSERQKAEKKGPATVTKSSSQRKVSKLVKPVTGPSNGIDFPYEVTLDALKAYHKEHENLCLPRRFLVPISEAYPSIWYGVDLAGTVYNMKWWQKHIKERPDRVSQLNQLGFVWERLQQEWNLVLEALIVYRGMYGDLLVPSNFTVSFNDPKWPKACWGIALGSVVFKIRNRNDHLRDVNTAWKRREQLDRIGFVWDAQELRFNRFCTALKLFAKIEQNDRMSLERQLLQHASASPQLFALKVPAKFVVPRSSRWPNEYWGYRLGERCTQVRQKQLYVKGHPSRLKTLADLGFYISSGNDCLKWLKVVHAAALYSQMHNNCLDVSTKFVVPAPGQRATECQVGDGAIPGEDNSCILESDDAWPWPEYLWGFPLGQRLRDIRVKGYFLRGEQAAIRRRQLDALGFNWEPQRGRPRKQ